MNCLLRCPRYSLHTVRCQFRPAYISNDTKITNIVQHYLPCAETVSPSALCESTDSGSISLNESINILEERQVNHKISGLFAIEKTRCKHGFPRAFVQLPINDVEMLSRDGTRTTTETLMQSGMVRLSCPHLVKAVDNFEYGGDGIPRLNAMLNQTDNAKNTTSLARTHNSQDVKRGNFVPKAEELRRHFRNINTHWKDLRSSLISDDQRRLLVARLGAESAEKFVAGGIGGLTADAVSDVKCLHLHVADALLRGPGANKFGEWAMETLEKEQRVDRNGCADCWQQCDRNHTRTASSWWYTSVKNKSGIRGSLAKRRSEKTRQQSTQTKGDVGSNSSDDSGKLSDAGDT